MSTFTKPFKVIVHNVPLKDKPFEVLESFEYYSIKYDGLMVNIPKGYRTDFASTPRVFWSFIPPVGRYSKAAVIHDYMIDETDMDIGIINDIFFEAMTVADVRPVTKYLMYEAVVFYWKFGVYVSNFIRKVLNKELENDKRK